MKQIILVIVKEVTLVTLLCVLFAPLARGSLNVGWRETNADGYATSYSEAVRQHMMVTHGQQPQVT